jgi:hypothetical protein
MVKWEVVGGVEGGVIDVEWERRWIESNHVMQSRELTEALVKDAKASDIERVKEEYGWEFDENEELFKKWMGSADYGDGQYESGRSTLHIKTSTSLDADTGQALYENRKDIWGSDHYGGDWKWTYVGDVKFVSRTDSRVVADIYFHTFTFESDPDDDRMHSSKETKAAGGAYMRVETIRGHDAYAGDAYDWELADIKITECNFVCAGRNGDPADWPWAAPHAPELQRYQDFTS